VEGELAAAKKSMQVKDGEMRTLVSTQHTKEAAIASLNKALDASNAAQAAVRQELSRSQAALKVRSIQSPAALAGACSNAQRHSDLAAALQRVCLLPLLALRSAGCPQAAESAAAALTSELAVTRDQLSRSAAVAGRAAAADARLVNEEGTVPAGVCLGGVAALMVLCWGCWS
jgi:septal ring factor EnvC (AmiA/AmiB activator)